MGDSERSLWWSKLKWQFISFKFISFTISFGLLIAAWVSIERIFDKTVEIAVALHKNGHITKDAVKDIVTHSQTVLYDATISHVLTFAGVIIGAIIAIKGVSYYTDGKQTQEVIRKLNGDATKEDLKKFLPTKGQ